MSRGSAFPQLSLKASRFLAANAHSPVVYGSVEAHSCTYRLADGSTWTFQRREASALGHPRWAHLGEAA
jgi:hypothetical protein